MGPWCEIQGRGPGRTGESAPLLQMLLSAFAPSRIIICSLVLAANSLSSELDADDDDRPVGKKLSLPPREFG